MRSSGAGPGAAEEGLPAPGDSADQAGRRLRRLVSRAYGHYGAQKSLKVPRGGPIRAGRAGGLPFDSLTSDLMLGCLPATQICYGNCFAARAAFESGYDFGTRVPNVLDEETFRADLDALPEDQGYLRNGWNSDASWDWATAARLTELIHASGRHTVFITKVFRPVPEDLATRMAALGAELRISVSAFDTEAQLRLRTRTSVQYRAAGGVVVPVIMTSRFRDAELAHRQDLIVDYFRERDFPLGENSLRFVPGSPVLEAIETDALRSTSDTGDLWSGRLYEDLPVPTLTSVPAQYRGLASGYLSENDAGSLAALWHEPVPTHTQVLSPARQAKPRQCGVALDWPRGAAEAGPGGGPIAPLGQEER